ncbi:MAG: hypothetical protein PHW98_04865 [Candidatus Omnitrophica bacterium]|nr:hypothetical protein [Candidatus Omnitrophota bacterium]
MRRNVLFSLSLSLIFLLSALFIFNCPSCFAEEITITTYYPSPYGSYNELQTNKLAVGDTNGNGNLDAADQPPANGQLYTARSVIYKPQSPLPASDTREGEVVYNNSDKQLYVYKGSSVGWQAIGTGGITYTYYCFSSSDFGTPVCTNAGGTQGYCPSGYTQKAALGSWGYCPSGPFAAASGYLLPPGGSCGPGCAYSGVLGSAYVCSQ